MISHKSVTRFFLFSLITGIFLGIIALDKAHTEIVCLWHFDEVSGKELKDSSGNGNNGEILGGKWVDGKIGGALEFSGNTDNGVIIEHKPNQNPALYEQITVEAWVKVLSNPSDNQGNIIRKGIWTEGKPTTGWGLDINNDLSVRGFVYLEPGSASLVAPGTVALELENWHHLAFTYDEKAVNVYVDGEVYGTVEASGTLEENEENMAIGIRPDSTRAFTGIIDEVVVWSVARKQEQIKEDMNGVSAAVESSGKLATTWSTIKTRY